MTATHQQSGHRLQLIERTFNMGIFVDLDCENSRIKCAMDTVVPYFDRSEVLDEKHDS